jgi:hypothetical protein
MTGNLILSSVGNGIAIREGTNAKQGTAIMVGGTIIISNTAVTANSRIFLTLQNCNSCGTPYISAKNANANFTISSTNILDSSTVAYEIFEPS